MRAVNKSYALKMNIIVILTLYTFQIRCTAAYCYAMEPGDVRSWECSQPLPALFIGHSEHVERFRKLKFAVKRITDIQNTVLSSFGGTAAIHLVSK